MVISRIKIVLLIRLGVRGNPYAYGLLHQPHGTIAHNILMPLITHTRNAPRTNQHFATSAKRLLTLRSSRTTNGGIVFSFIHRFPLRR
jgi:hypothetical protein